MTYYNWRLNSDFPLKTQKFCFSQSRDPLREWDSYSRVSSANWQIQTFKSSNQSNIKLQSVRQEVHLLVEACGSSRCLFQLVGDLLTLQQTDRLFDFTGTYNNKRPNDSSLLRAWIHADCPEGGATENIAGMMIRTIQDDLISLYWDVGVWLCSRDGRSCEEVTCLVWVGLHGWCGRGYLSNVGMLPIWCGHCYLYEEGGVTCLIWACFLSEEGGVTRLKGAECFW